VGVVVMAVEQTTNREGVTVSSPGDLVYVLRSCKSDGTSHGGFRWPDSGPVECPDWSPAAECGHGLHGLLWGIGDWGLTALSDPNSKWYVVAVPAETGLDGRVQDLLNKTFRMLAPRSAPSNSLEPVSASASSLFVFRSSNE
jgi:hypothetical protein